MLIRETENSIKIEIVSHLNQLNLRPELVSRVGGEQSVKGDSYLFPDVMIFDANGVPIQGWELKYLAITFGNTCQTFANISNLFFVM